MKQEKTTIEEYLFLLVYGVWFLLGNLYITFWTRSLPVRELFGLMKWVPMILFCVSVIMSYKQDVRKTILMFTLILLWYVCSYNAKMSIVMQFLLLALCARNINHKKILKLYLIIALGVMVITCICSKIGIVYNRITGERQALGYKYVSYPTIILLGCTLAYLALREFVKWYEMLVVIVINMLMYSFTKTRVVLGVLAVTIVIYLINRAFRRYQVSHFFKLILTICPFALAGISYLAQWAYDGSNIIWIRLNEILSNRLILGNTALANYDHKLFGQKVEWVTLSGVTAKKPYFFVDNFYLHYGLSFGIVFLLVIMTMFSLLVFRLISDGEITLALGIIGILIMGIIDPEVLDLRFHPFVLFLGYIFKDKEEIKYEKEV